MKVFWEGSEFSPSMFDVAQAVHILKARRKVLKLMVDTSTRLVCRLVETGRSGTIEFEQDEKGVRVRFVELPSCESTYVYDFWDSKKIKEAFKQIEDYIEKGIKPTQQF